MTTGWDFISPWPGITWQGITRGVIVRLYHATRVVQEQGGILLASWRGMTQTFTERSV